jgi:hypothetical protein
VVFTEAAYQAAMENLCLFGWNKLSDDERSIINYFYPP